MASQDAWNYLVTLIERLAKSVPGTDQTAADLNGAIGDLKAQLARDEAAEADLASRVSALESTVAALTQDQGAADAAVGQLQTDLGQPSDPNQASGSDTLTAGSGTAQDTSVSASGSDTLAAAGDASTGLSGGAGVGDGSTAV